MTDGPSKLQRRQVEALESIAASLEKMANPTPQQTVYWPRKRTRLQDILWEINEPKLMQELHVEFRDAFLP